MTDVVRLERRAEFKAAAQGARWHASAFQLQATRRSSVPDAGRIGVGFTATKRLGGAVVRNRARRRLKEAIRSVLPNGALAGCNYVVIAKPAALTCAFAELKMELERGLVAVSRKLARRHG